MGIKKGRSVNNTRSVQAGVVQAAKRRGQQWQEDNAKAIAGSNAYVEAEGLPLARHRQF